MAGDYPRHRGALDQSIAVFQQWHRLRASGKLNHLGSDVNRIENARPASHRKMAGHSWQGTRIIDHGSFIYLMGPDGKFLTLFPPVMPPDAMAAAIGRYLG